MELPAGRVDTFFLVKIAPAVRPSKDHRGIDLISDALPFGRLL